MNHLTIPQLIGEKGIFTDGDWVESKDQDPSGSVRLIQLADIGDGVFLDKSNRRLTKEKAVQLRCTFLRKGDILIARMPEPLGRCCIFPKLDEECVTVVDVCIVRISDPNHHPQFISRIINSHELRKQIERQTTGTTRKRISRGNLSKIEIPLPPLDDLLKSVFLDMFGDPVRNEKGWERLPLEKLGSLNRGISKHRPRNAPELLGGKYPLIQTGEVSNAGTYITSFAHTYSDLGFAQSKLWPSGTLCITIAANIAQTAILTFEACFPDSVVGFAAFENETHPLYVHGLFWFFQKILEKNAPAAAQKNINLEILRGLKVPRPPFERQQQFANVVEKIENIKFSYQQSLTDLESLYGALSQKAFKGDLDLSNVPLPSESKSHAA